MHKGVIRRKLSDEVAVRLEELIRSGRYPVGSSLPSERELMTLYEVGRPSIREALHSLETMGLVRIHSGERPRVSRPTPHDMLEQLSGAAHLLLDEPEGVLHFEQMRLVLEEGLARHAATHASVAQIEVLARALDENERSIPSARAFASSDVAFHRVLMEMSGNPIFLAVHEALVEWLIGQRIPVADADRENRVSFDGHRRVVDAIRARDDEAAGRAMREHLENARRKFGVRGSHARAVD